MTDYIKGSNQSNPKNFITMEKDGSMLAKKWDPHLLAGRCFDDGRLFLSHVVEILQHAAFIADFNTSVCDLYRSNRPKRKSIPIQDNEG